MEYNIAEVQQRIALCHRPYHAELRRLLDAAQVLYDRVDAGVAQLPLSCRPGINAARYLYAEIGHEVARRARARDAAAETESLLGVAAWAAQFTPAVALEFPDALLLEVGLGGRAQLVDPLEEEEELRRQRVGSEQTTARHRADLRGQAGPAAPRWRR